ncbi:hypothetical protein A7L17_19695 [Acinetobacter baumannii]|nr:hypothetical protein A7L17_19695 [Acinetobacter baumannii]
MPCHPCEPHLRGTTTEGVKKKTFKETRVGSFPKTSSNNKLALSLEIQTVGLIGKKGPKKEEKKIRNHNMHRRKRGV